MALTRYIRSFNRFELKYLLPITVVPEFVAALGGRVYSDAHSVGEWGYPVYSVYCDSPELHLFWEKVEGYNFRRKLRFRRYAGDGEQIFVEIKQRFDRTLQKRRVLWSADRLRETFYAGPEAAPRGDDEDPVANEALFLWHHYDLEPRMAISYNRRALFATHESDLRITFDTRVQYHPADLDVSRPFESGKYVIDPERTILEIKYSDRVPLWLCKLVSDFEFEKIRMSKYCTAIDREYFDGTYT